MPFTHDEFFDVFAAYNAALWPAAVALWLMSLAAVLAFASGRNLPHRAVSGLLAVHWIWSALAYHAAFFARINPAAWLFAGLFLVQAALFLWHGVLRGRLHFSRGPAWSARHVAAATLLVYALGYPAINVAQGLVYPQMPTFGVPCPTTIFTIGLLLAAEALPWTLIVVPVIWSVIGGSGAFLFGVSADLVLPLAALCLVVSTLRSGQRDRAPVLSAIRR